MPPSLSDMIINGLMLTLLLVGGNVLVYTLFVAPLIGFSIIAFGALFTLIAVTTAPVQ